MGHICIVLQSLRLEKIVINNKQTPCRDSFYCMRNSISVGHFNADSEFCKGLQGSVDCGMSCDFFKVISASWMLWVFRLSFMDCEDFRFGYRIDI